MQHGGRPEVASFREKAKQHPHDEPMWKFIKLHKKEKQLTHWHHGKLSRYKKELLQSGTVLQCLLASTSRKWCCGIDMIKK